MPLFTVDPEKCKRDGICVSECPVRVIEIKGEKGVPQPIEGAEEYCINCGHCVAVCPHGALALNTMKPEQCAPVRRRYLPDFDRVDHFLRCRRSIRTYKEEPVDRETLTKLVETARYAPSGHNLQPVHWLVIERKEDVHRLGGIIVDWLRLMIQKQPQIAESLHFDRVVSAWENGLDRILRGAPHLIVAHGSPAVRLAQSACIIALSYLELAAFAAGLGACWAGYFTTAASSYEPLRKILALPDGHQTFGAMMVGHAKYAYHRVPLRNKPNIEWR